MEVNFFTNGCILSHLMNFSIFTRAWSLVGMEKAVEKLKFRMWKPMR